MSAPCESLSLGAEKHNYSNEEVWALELWENECVPCMYL